jgi:hypothetical protein
VGEEAIATCCVLCCGLFVQRFRNFDHGTTQESRILLDCNLPFGNAPINACRLLQIIQSLSIRCDASINDGFCLFTAVLRILCASSSCLAKHTAWLLDCTELQNGNQNTDPASNERPGIVSWSVGCDHSLGMHSMVGTWTSPEMGYSANRRRLGIASAHLKGYIVAWLIAVSAAYSSHTALT